VSRNALASGTVAAGAFAAAESVLVEDAGFSLLPQEHIRLAAQARENKNRMFI
jgi:hypothetical protein